MPRYDGVSDWDQYREVFEAIVASNGWDYLTAALQLLAHLDGEVLNVALLVPDDQRRRPGVLVETLTAHYTSPGRLAKHRGPGSIYHSLGNFGAEGFCGCGSGS